MARLALASEGFEVFELIGFHAQQAVEKLVKAYLAQHVIDFEDRHDFDYLQRLVAKADPGLAARIDPAAALNRYAVGTRYPGRYGPVSSAQAESAIRIAEAVRAEVLPHLQDASLPDSLRARHRQQRDRAEDT
jgi:HEPN domain-containing protein